MRVGFATASCKRVESQLELSGKLAAQEKEMIEAALRESGGQVSGHQRCSQTRLTGIYLNRRSGH